MRRGRGRGRGSLNWRNRSFENETIAFILRVMQDGGVVRNQRMIDKRIKFLKQNNLWESLQFEGSASFAVKLSNGKITVLYNIKGTGDATNPDIDPNSKPTDIIVGEINGTEIGTPANHTRTYLYLPNTILKNRSSAWIHHYVKLLVIDDDYFQPISAITTSNINQILVQISKRNSQYWIVDQQGKFYTSMQRSNGDSVVNIFSDEAEQSPGWNRQSLVLDWEGRTAEYRINNTVQGQKLTNLFTGDKSENADHASAMLYSNTVYGAFGKGITMLDSVFADVIPTDRQLQLNDLWITTNLRVAD